MPPQPVAAARLKTLVETRERIVCAARDVVAEEGWQGAQVALIAARAGIATGSVYCYFASKAELYTEVLGAVSQREVEVIRGIVEGKGPAALRLAEAIHAFARRAMKVKRLSYTLIAEPCEPEINAARLRYRAMFVQKIVGVIRDGVASGEFAAVDEQVAASCVVGAFMGALTASLAPGTKGNAKACDRIASTIAQLCVRMVLKSGKPLPVLTQ